MISKNLAKDVLNACLETGGDFAEIFIEDTVKDLISLDNGNCEQATTNYVYGAGIRILKGLQSVYGYTNDLSRSGLMNLACNLSKSFHDQRIKTVNEIKTVRVGKSHQPKVPYENVSKKERIDYLLKGSNACMNYDKKIVRVMIGFTSTNQKVYIFNSDGKFIRDTRVRGRCFINAIASNGVAIESSGEGPGALKGFEFFNDEIDIVKVGEDVARVACMLLDAKECPSGKMPVIIGNGFGGVIFHEACGHSLEASSVSKNLSVFSNKLGTQIASSIVSAVDDGTIEGAWGSENVDDEGHKTHRNLLIKNGVLNSYLVDSFNGRRMNAHENGASRRESYKFEPTSRMSNTFILPGKSTPEEIIKATKFGLYAKSMGGGSVNPATGEFNFAVNEAYIVENGEIAYPVKGATLIGSGKDVLLKIDMVGNDLKRAQGMCGAASGSVPTDVGQPTIRVSEMTVGGRGEKLN
ncbi:MAG: TldD/PmbA family protein [Bacillales bacterium]|nr:TldD/PmbA family protein [Bacillales bacterium]